MTGAGDPDGAELAIKSGAWDYLEKPSSMNMMILPLVRALQYRDVKLAQKPLMTLKRQGIVGSSPSMMACLERVAHAAGYDASVLITGETGTGKEGFAWAIHENSRRADKNFVVVDAAMNDLARPALYDAWHDILPVAPRGTTAAAYDIVGPVCESGDWIGRERALAVQAGDVLAVLSAGAYGMAMASNYNTRPRAAEVLIVKGQPQLVREREQAAQLFAGERVLT